MGDVTIQVDGRDYQIACDPGQEPRVQQLAGYIDQRMREIGGGSGAVNKAQLMMLTALVLADEIFDLKDHLNRLTHHNNQLQREPKEIIYNGLDPVDETEITEAISTLAARVETLSERIRKS